jgi:hypothetical protein
VPKAKSELLKDAGTLRDLTAGSGLSYERREQLDLALLARPLELDAAR